MTGRGRERILGRKRVLSRGRERIRGKRRVPGRGREGRLRRQALELRVDKWVVVVGREAGGAGASVPVAVGNTPAHTIAASDGVTYSLVHNCRVRWCHL